MRPTAIALGFPCVSHPLSSFISGLALGLPAFQPGTHAQFAEAQFHDTVQLVAGDRGGSGVRLQVQCSWIFSFLLWQE